VDQQITALPGGEKHHVRTLFISDVHLGTRGCQAEMLLEFLRSYDAETIYVVGDMIDFWRIKRSPYWPQQHNDVVQKLLRKVRKGTRLVYIPGNHDEDLRPYCGMNFGGIEFKLNDVHIAANGERYLIMHGDEFDVVVRYAKWLALLGDWAYAVALGINVVFNAVRRRLGMPYWSLSAYLKQRVKKAVNFAGSFENMLSTEARRHGVGGVICGHIHRACKRDMGGITYINTGDWVESCTGVVEKHDGTFEIIDWLCPKVRAAHANAGIKIVTAA
jgi:UDP-2,3-diacylglucosamine pyrophosphatase LpxH